MAEKSQLPRMSWVGLYFLCGITAGIYMFFWYAKVLKGMNKLNNTPENGKTMFIVLIASYILGVVSYIIGAVSMAKSAATMMMANPSALTAGSMPVMPSVSPFMTIGPILLLVAMIIMIVFSFQFRSILIKKCGVSIGGLWTFLFTTLNIQFAINRAYDKGALVKGE